MHVIMILCWKHMQTVMVATFFWLHCWHIQHYMMMLVPMIHCSQCQSACVPNTMQDGLLIAITVLFRASTHGRSQLDHQKLVLEWFNYPFLDVKLAARRCPVDLEKSTLLLAWGHPERGKSCIELESGLACSLFAKFLQRSLLAVCKFCAAGDECCEWGHGRVCVNLWYRMLWLLKRIQTVLYVTVGGYMKDLKKHDSEKEVVLCAHTAAYGLLQCGVAPVDTWAREEGGNDTEYWYENYLRSAKVSNWHRNETETAVDHPSSEEEALCIKAGPQMHSQNGTCMYTSITSSRVYQALQIDQRRYDSITWS